MRNWLRHLLGMNHGSVMSWTTPEGRIWIGFMCECGTIHGLHDASHVIDKAIHGGGTHE